MKDASQKNIDKPASAAANSSDGPDIFVMPKAFRNGKTPQSKVIEPAAAKKQPPKIPPKNPKPKTVHQRLKPKRKKKRWVVLGVLFLVLGVMIIVGAFVQTRETEELEFTVPVTRPTTPDKPPIPEVEPEEPEEASVPLEESVFPTTSSPGIDSDSDGLTDQEERLIYKTNVQLPDTDRDGFLDGNEVFHRYNPNGSAPATLFESGVIRVAPVLEQGQERWELMYPTSWSLEQDGTVLRALVATTGERFTLQINPKDTAQSLGEWFRASGSTKTILSSRSKNGYELLVSDDQKTVFVDAGASVFVFGYDPGARATLEYLQTFQMMLNSLIRQDEPS